MTAQERLADLLKVSGKVRGFRQPIYRDDNTIDHYAQHHIEVVAGDVLEIASTVTDPNDKIAAALRKGCGNIAAETRVAIYADDLYHLLDAAKPSAAA